MLYYDMYNPQTALFRKKDEPSTSVKAAQIGFNS